MASALDDEEIDNDDYYSLLNVRREVHYSTTVTLMPVHMHVAVILEPFLVCYVIVRHIIRENVS